MKWELESLWFLSMKMSSTVETVTRKIISEQSWAVVDFCPSEPCKGSAAVVHFTLSLANAAGAVSGEAQSLLEAGRAAEYLPTSLGLIFLLIQRRCLNWNSASCLQQLFCFLFKAECCQESKQDLNVLQGECSVVNCHACVLSSLSWLIWWPCREGAALMVADWWLLKNGRAMWMLQHPPAE